MIDLILISIVRLSLVTLIILFIVKLCPLKFPQKLPLPPGPYSIPFLGYLPFVGQDFHLRLTELGKKYGSIYQIYLGSKRVVVINDAKLIKEAFRQPVFSGRPDTELTRILQGYGIVNTEGALWKEQRAFLHSVLRKLGAKSMILGRDCLELKIRSQVKVFLNDLKTASSKSLNIRPYLACAASNVIGSLLMSMTFKSSDKKFRRIIELMEEGFRLFAIAMPVNFIPLFRFVPLVNYAYEKMKCNRDETSRYFHEIVEEHRNTLDEENVRDFVDAYLVQHDRIKESGQQSFFSEKQLIQVMNDIFSAGLENVTSTIEWSVLFLMLNPNIQRKIQQEIDEVIGNEREPQLTDLENMPYTEATFWEVLRRSNIVALGNTHSTLEDSTLAGYSIPATTHILPNLYAINMDPELWINPDQFNPERFLKDGKVHKPDYFIPFSVGRRMCLGDILTKMEVFLFLTNLLQQFDLQVPENEKRPEVASIVSASMAPKPFKVCLRSRN
ncbi:8-oxo-dGDP phosphatase NUDT18 [Sarcoptes scabiei]|uniref:Cytochrome P450-like protein 20 n=1 Tax=Sarcoptes scabiei TaxID=52283 RepID=A0A132AFF6_SARSC|nr:cytochrome P450-like protein 20 [Sarcoptes scabiei]UXI14933.1 8-oxo-dGDP phosphatase NUDT18 [Sarcoptes scabiei]